MQENSTFLFDRPLPPPLGQLAAIELADRQAHLQPFKPEHQAAFEALVRTKLETLVDRETSDAGRTNAATITDLTTELTKHDQTNSLTFGIFEGAWGDDGPLLGCVGLRRDEEARREVGVRLASLTFPPRQAFTEMANQSVLIYAQEHWNTVQVSTLKGQSSGFSRDVPWDSYPPLPSWLVPKDTYETWHNVYYRLPEQIKSLQGTDFIYTSPARALGTIRGQLYDEADFYEVLAEDIKVCKERIILGGLWMMKEQCLQLLPALRQSVSNGLPVEVYLPFKPARLPEGLAVVKPPPWKVSMPDRETRQRNVVEQLQKAGLEIFYRNILPQAAVLDRRVLWEVVSPLSGWNDDCLKRITAERPFPMSLIRSRRTTG